VKASKISQRILPAVIGFILLLSALEVLSFMAILNSTLFPPPSALYKALLEIPQDFYKAFMQTFSNVIFGFVASFILGLLLAIVFSLSNFLQAALLPYALFFQTVPIIAIAPLLVIYFGFGNPTVIASSFIVSLFPIIANSLIGLNSAPQNSLELFQIYRASPWQTLWKLRLPMAYPYIVGGLKISAGLSIIGAIAGEFVAGGGLGAIIDAARTQQRIDLVYVCLVLLSMMGLAMIAIISVVDAVIKKWRPL